ncbi:hypothetical protein EV356DRAFT_307812 [Viridothelium virens]|uniref:Uncharacterized protein n=1 Tax=Viridothelium virens TaxID=1048519 RepID=A0A6A6HKQ9_VIRVR|nr:hypothetical protein EV356DRAFT_307812 [Viridothelium virens]
MRMARTGLHRRQPSIGETKTSHTHDSWSIGIYCSVRQQKAIASTRARGNFGPRPREKQEGCPLESKHSTASRDNESASRFALVFQDWYTCWAKVMTPALTEGGGQYARLTAIQVHRRAERRRRSNCKEDARREELGRRRNHNERRGNISKQRRRDGGEHWEMEIMDIIPGLSPCRASARLSAGVCLLPD